MSVLRPNVSQVVTYAKGYTSPMLLGALGHVANLQYSSTMPGGCDQLSCTLQIPASARTQYMDSARYVRAYRGATVMFDGKMDEPSPGTDGWSIVAHGAGTFGTDFDMIYSGSWSSSSLNDAVDQAITRGLRWVRGTDIGAVSGIYTGDTPDSGSQKIDSMLTNATAKGGLMWQVDSWQGKNVLTVTTMPTVVTRLLVAVNPVARTLLDDVNTLHLRYQTAADNATTGALATYAIATVTNAASLAVHDPIEMPVDLTSAGVISSGTATGVGNAILSQYQRASFGGPFTVQTGQLLTPGGVMVDPGTEMAGEVYRLILTDFGYGGEISPKPIIFPGAAVAFDDESYSLNITPVQSGATDLSTIISNAVAALPPPAPAVAA
jgi:hypothetical protein